MATSKYVSASLAFPWARFDFAEEIKEAIGVSEGISEGDMQRAKGEVSRTAPRAIGKNRVIIVLMCD